MTIYILAFASVMGLLLLLQEQEFLERWPQTESRKRKLALIKGFRNLAASLAIVSLFFCYLQWWMDSTADKDYEAQTIWMIEVKIHAIKERTERFDKTKFWPALLLLVGLIFLARRYARVARLRLKERYQRVVKAVGYFTGLVSIAASFTFYGAVFAKGEKGVVGQLQLHELRIIEDNQLLVKRIRTEVEVRVTAAILTEPSVERMLYERERIKFHLDTTMTAFRNYLSTPLGRHNKEVENCMEEYRRMASINAQSEREALAVPHVKEVPIQQQAGDKQEDLSSDENWGRLGALGIASEAVPARATGLYKTYGEVLDKIIEQGYAVTVKTWTKDATKAVLSTVPFVDEFLDPVHDMVTDVIQKKVKRLYEMVVTKNPKSIAPELQDLETTVQKAMYATIGWKQAVKAAEAQVEVVSQKIDRMLPELMERHPDTRRSMQTYFAQRKPAASAADPWEEYLAVNKFRNQNRATDPYRSPSQERLGKTFEERQVEEQKIFEEQEHFSEKLRLRPRPVIER